jgi:hypothetical protein
MKTIQALTILLFVAACVAPIHAEDPSHWWARDLSSPDTVRLGDMRRACRVETTGGVVRLFAESEGKLVLYWEAKDQKCADAVRQQMVWAPSVFTPIGNDAFVSKDSVASIAINRSKDGIQVFVLRGLSTELATVSDAAAIKILKGQFQL